MIRVCGVVYVSLPKSNKPITSLNKVLFFSQVSKGRSRRHPRHLGEHGPSKDPVPISPRVGPQFMIE